MLSEQAIYEQLEYQVTWVLDEFCRYPLTDPLLDVQYRRFRQKTNGPMAVYAEVRDAVGFCWITATTEGFHMQDVYDRMSGRTRWAQMTWDEFEAACAADV